MFDKLSVLTNEPMITYPNLDSSLTFSKYILKCRSLIKDRRTDLSSANSSVNCIIDANCPYELYPNDATQSNNHFKCGVLLIHGLFDSPFTLKDIGLSLQSKGILSRAILLPGHGTVPSDLSNISYQHWIETVNYGVESLRQNVEKIFLVGYSTGAALSIYQALKNKHIAGLVLIAPALKIKAPIDIVVAWHRLKKWTKKDKKWMYYDDENDYAKYQSIAFNPVTQVAKLIDIINELQTQQSLKCPLFMVMSREDETISSDTAIDFFSTLHHENNKLLLYTSYHHRYPDPRILARQTQYPDLHINHFSHMAIPFAPNNSHYGQAGDYAYASHINPEFAYGAYNRIEEKAYEVLHKYGLVKLRRRALTYNPDFDFMAEKITRFILET